MLRIKVARKPQYLANQPICTINCASAMGRPLNIGGSCEQIWCRRSCQIPSFRNQGQRHGPHRHRNPELPAGAGGTRERGRSRAGPHRHRNPELPARSHAVIKNVEQLTRGEVGPSSVNPPRPLKRGLKRRKLQKPPPSPVKTACSGSGPVPRASLGRPAQRAPHGRTGGNLSRRCNQDTSPGSPALGCRRDGQAARSAVRSTRRGSTPRVSRLDASRTIKVCMAIIYPHGRAHLRRLGKSAPRPTVFSAAPWPARRPTTVSVNGAALPANNVRLADIIRLARPAPSISNRRWRLSRRASGGDGRRPSRPRRGVPRRATPTNQPAAA